MTHPLKQWPLMPTDTLNGALKPPSRVLDPHRRTLFTQRLAVLIQRLRVVGTRSMTIWAKAPLQLTNARAFSS